MMKLSWAFAASIVTLLTVWVHQPAQAQTTFDCRRPPSQTAAMLCRDPELVALDRLLEQDYDHALNVAADPQRVRGNHTAWANSLSICANDRDCVYRALVEERSQMAYYIRSGEPVSEPTVAMPLTVPKEPEVPVGAVDADVAPEDAAVDPSEFTASYENPEEAGANEVPSVNQERVSTPVSHTPRRETVGDLQREIQGKPMVAILGGGMFFGLILAVVVALIATKALADYTTKRYNWPLILNWWNLLHFVGAVAGVFVFSFGGLVMGLVVFAGCWLVVLAVNIIKTNLFTGVAMTVVQPLVVAILWVLYGAMRAKAEERRI